MRYEIDQSGKIENTSKDTVLCLSNDKKHLLLIKSSTKRHLQTYFRSIKEPRNFVLFTFCARLSKLIEKVKLEHKRLVIDNEYTGKEKAVRNILSDILPLVGVEIEIGFIGKSSNAHKAVYTMAKGKRLKNYEIAELKYSEIIKIVKVIQDTKRPTNA